MYCNAPSVSKGWKQPKPLPITGKFSPQANPHFAMYSSEFPPPKMRTSATKAVLCLTHRDSSWVTVQPRSSWETPTRKLHNGSVGTREGRGLSKYQTDTQSLFADGLVWVSKTQGFLDQPPPTLSWALLAADCHHHVTWVGTQPRPQRPLAAETCTSRRQLAPALNHRSAATFAIALYQFNLGLKVQGDCQHLRMCRFQSLP